MKLPVSRKRYDTALLAFAKLQETLDAQVQKGYKDALSLVEAELRAFLVDWNYELYNAPDGLLKSKVYSMMSSGLAQFHERARAR